MHKIVRAAFCVGAFLVLHAQPLRSEPLNVRFGSFAPPADLGSLLFTKKDVLRHYGKSYVISPISFVASSVTVSAIAANQIDVTGLATPALALAIQNANLTDLRVIASEVQDGVPGRYTSQSMVLKDGPIKTVKDLKGKVVATPSVGSAVDIGLRIMLRRNQLEAGRDYTVIQVAPANMKAFLMQGKADLVTVSTPLAFDPELLAASRVLFTRRDIWQGTSESIFWAARAGYLQQHRPVMVDLMEDILRATRWFTDPANRPQAMAMLAEATKRPAAELDSWVYTEKDSGRDPNALPNLVSMQRELDAMKEAGFLKIDIDVKKYADLSIVEEAGRRLK